MAPAQTSLPPVRRRGSHHAVQTSLPLASRAVAERRRSLEPGLPDAIALQRDSDSVANSVRSDSLRSTSLPMGVEAPELEPIKPTTAKSGLHVRI